MFKRMLIIGLVNLTVIAMSATGAMPLRIGGRSITGFWSSITMDAIILGVRDIEQFDGLLYIRITLVDGYYQCWNPAGRAEPSESPNFDFKETTLGLGQPKAFWVPVKQGKAQAQLYYSNEAIKAAAATNGVFIEPEVLCQNANWILDWSVTSFYADVWLLHGDAGTCNGSSNCTGCITDEYQYIHYWRTPSLAAGKYNSELITRITKNPPPPPFGDDCSPL